MATVTLDKRSCDGKANQPFSANRAQFHAGGLDFATPLDIPTVTIPKSDHDNLLSSARQYANLRRNLYRGGIAEETLAILIKDDSPANENGNKPTTMDESVENRSFFAQQSTAMNSKPETQDYTFGRNANYTPRSDFRPRERNSNGFHTHSQTNDDFAFMPDGPDGFYDDGSGHNDSQQRQQRQQYDKFAKRTVLLANLPESTTHLDLVEAIKGGMLLDLYLRSHDRTASVSFLEETAAQEFFSHVKRHDLYIKGKRVEIRWNDRQFILPGHVANKVSIGATRNLVIYNCSPKHTEDKIREDLEHIHNLVVIKVSFAGQNVYISTNSVHNAMFARTCMMSRSIYKGSKIEWDNDECAAPLERPLQSRKENIPQKKKAAPLMNRFHLLNMDDDDNDSLDEDDDENDISGVTLPSALKASPTSIAA
ncbi:uncharacterized protein LY89DRAFT_666691 [Mollisia scopiformis]|uniref:RRM domain-containing protein n=1 Tax=Mollisia scopiformis TaxID=149040 RepID=A0A194XJA8_MOLSC|nr:uncharacterized protein LY89DRAFT_666691 [Mollisia scopiformis]KUJ19842.1 hypothetical protein LY89DRAFT_666691 [Mollisia scopiformis]